MTEPKRGASAVAPPPGPVSLFRNKVRKPVTITMTEEHHEKVDRAMRRLSLSRADLIALLIDQFADTVKIVTKAMKGRR